MKKVTLSLLLLSFLLFSSPAFSQRNYTPGYVVLLNGDTARGLIDYRRWDYNPSDISFITQTGSEEIKYRPSIIRSFTVSGEIFESAFVELEKSPDQTHRLSTDPAPVLKKDTVFLQVLF